MRHKKIYLLLHTPSKRFRESLPFNELIHRPWQATPVQLWRQFCNGLPTVIVHKINQTKGRCFVVKPLSHQGGVLTATAWRARKTQNAEVGAVRSPRVLRDRRGISTGRHGVS